MSIPTVIPINVLGRCDGDAHGLRVERLSWETDTQRLAVGLTRVDNEDVAIDVEFSGDRPITHQLW